MTPSVAELLLAAGANVPVIPAHVFSKIGWNIEGSRSGVLMTPPALAESFRSELMTAARKGEAFRVTDGMPVSKMRTEDQRSWYTFSCSYVDLKWKAAAATYRRGIAEAMVTVTMAMLTEERGRPPDDKAIRSALFRWAFNTPQRTSGQIPQDAAEILRWVEGNTRSVGDLADRRHLRSVADAIASKLDGSLAAATVVNRKRAVLFNALDYAVEEGLLQANPLPTLKWSTPRKATVEIDRRSVVNPVQARTLLNAIRETKRSGRQLYACFACSYFAALRPEEAVNLRRADISLPTAARNPRQNQLEPASDWGELSLRMTAPHAGREWTNSGRARDRRGLKHRAEGEERIVPIPPELTQILREHLYELPLDADGRLFYGDQGGELPVITYNRIWHKARAATFVEDVLATPLARTPYTLRHAAVSTWLAGGVDPTQVAAWAGHSLEVLLKVYAKSLHGRDQAARTAMGESYR